MMLIVLPWKLPRAAHDALSAVGDAFDEGSPSACGLQRRFHRLRARVHGQSHTLARKRAEHLAEFAEQPVVEGAGREGDTVQLLLGGGDDLGMTVSEIERAVSGEHIEVLPAVGVADARALRPRHDDGLGRVIVRTISLGLRDDAGGDALVFGCVFRNGSFSRGARQKPLCPLRTCGCLRASVFIIIGHNRTSVNECSVFYTQFNKTLQLPKIRIFLYNIVFNPLFVLHMTKKSCIIFQNIYM